VTDAEISQIVGVSGPVGKSAQGLPESWSVSQAFTSSTVYAVGSIKTRVRNAI
jgi:hypothetical protein